MERLTNNFDYCKMIECEFFDEELLKQKKCKAFDVGIEHCHEKRMNDKLREYEDAEEQGLLLRLPCKVGDEIYWISDEDEEGNEGLCVRGKSYVDGIAFIDGEFRLSSGDGSWDVPNKTRWCYLTREEAEAALERMGEDERN